MSDSLKIGDVVRLKSGGPKMTVTNVGENYGTLTAWCAWFDGTKPGNGTYPVGSLEIASDLDGNVAKAIRR